MYAMMALRLSSSEGAGEKGAARVLLERWRGGEEIKAGAGEGVGGGEETKASEWCCRLVELER